MPAEREALETRSARGREGKTRVPAREGMPLSGRFLTIQLTVGKVRCLRLRRLGPALNVEGYAERALPPALLVPSPTIPNVTDEGLFGQILADAAGPHPPLRTRVVVPSRSVLLHALSTGSPPARTPDLRGFLLWCAQGLLPFEAREARLAYTLLRDGSPGRHTAILLSGRERVVAQYERLCGALGGRVVHLAPVAWHLFTRGGGETTAALPGTEAFLALEEDAATLILCRGGTPHYVRTFGLPRQTPSAPVRSPATIEALREELHASFHHAEDTAGLSPPRGTLLAGELPEGRQFAAALGEALGLPCALAAPPRQLRWARGLPPEAEAVVAAAAPG